MFDMSMSELLIVVVIALITIGPKNLPRALHTVGRWVSRARAMASEFHRHLDEIVHDAELEDLHRKIADKKTITEVVEKTFDTVEVEKTVDTVDTDLKMHNSFDLPFKGKKEREKSTRNKPSDVSEERTVQRESAGVKSERLLTENPSCSPQQQPPPASSL